MHGDRNIIYTLISKIFFIIERFLLQAIFNLNDFYHVISSIQEI